MRSQNWWAPKRAPLVRLKGESSSLTWNCPSGLIALRSLTSKVSRHACARPPRLFLVRAQRLVLLVDRYRDAAAADAPRHRHHGVRRLRKQRMVIVGPGSFRPRQIGHVDDPKARVPAACPHLVAEAQRMVKAVPPTGPSRRLATLDVLPRHPPA